MPTHQVIVKFELQHLYMVLFKANNGIQLVI